MNKYEIRKEGRVFCAWNDHRLTPPPATLKAMKAAGYRLYIDGRPARNSQRSVQKCV